MADNRINPLPFNRPDKKDEKKPPAKTAPRPPARKTSPAPKKAAPSKTPPKRRKKKRSPESKRRLSSILILLLTLYFMFNLFIAAFIYFSYNSTPADTQLYSLRLRYDDTTVHSMDSNEANNNRGLYVSFNKLGDICKIGAAGDSESITLLTSGDGGRIVCYRDSAFIRINENEFLLSAPVLFEGDDYMIPIELVETYINGVSVEYDEQRMRCTLSGSSAFADLTLKPVYPEGIGAMKIPNNLVSSEPEDQSQ